MIKIIGLRFDTLYEDEDDLKTLRYGKVMIMADQVRKWKHTSLSVVKYVLCPVELNRFSLLQHYIFTVCYGPGLSVDQVVVEPYYRRQKICRGTWFQIDYQNFHTFLGLRRVAHQGPVNQFFPCKISRITSAQILGSTHNSNYQSHKTLSGLNMKLYCGPVRPARVTNFAVSFVF